MMLVDIEFETPYSVRGVVVALGNIALLSLQLLAPPQSRGYSRPRGPPS